ncbi:DNA/RNA non-specific endonuclease [Flavobacterium sp. F-380]|uniref:DNA/RNA non-specific endonuclease n=1 Tax=Flavobacterium kayseriense TaxID=2764714 RepID=A0ABR7J6A2_9FLAO|nr:DNA/RNA non-specific endonuclease [Flavobacterium kayseriense]MBC5840938.1 DNA/RNA non-specific endonuclease [Flavobacterium kayseriense]MBC5846393.1 DNA/RNA non-specific endonuclease [Flavobacterium kayseriense]
MEFNLGVYNDTFLTSNMAPQDHDCNSSIWNRLEQKVRFWAEKYNGVYVVVRGVLNPSLKTIGYEDIAIPEQFHKVVLDESNGCYKMIAFRLPNKTSEKPLFNYVVSVDYIEKIPGINFFPALEDSIENKLEKSVDSK